VAELYCWLAGRFPGAFRGRAQAQAARDGVSALIDNALKRLSLGRAPRAGAGAGAGTAAAEGPEEGAPWEGEGFGSGGGGGGASGTEDGEGVEEGGQEERPAAWVRRAQELGVRWQSERRGGANGRLKDGAAAGAAAAGSRAAVVQRARGGPREGGEGQQERRRRGRQLLFEVLVAEGCGGDPFAVGRAGVQRPDWRR
ncbi:hypothetical protein MNEG_8244, partial [Monoraphidium neglectum]|jgi:hypothetical protein